MLCKQPSLPECPEGMFVVRKEKREMSKKCSNFRIINLTEQTELQKSFWEGEEEDEDKRASEGK